MAIFLKIKSSDETTTVNNSLSDISHENSNVFPASVNYALHSLPNEVLLRVFSHLNADDIIRCSQVCRRWHVVANDWHLWNAKVLELMSCQWCTIVCYKRPLNTPSFRDPGSIHPRHIYRFLVQFIPKCQLTDTVLTKIGKTFDEFSSFRQIRAIPSDQLGTSTAQDSLSIRFRNWWNQLLNLFPPSRHSSANTIHRPRFALFGPGFDHRDTNGLFRKMVDTRTKSFEPIDMFTGHMGFGSGITLRLFAQAQNAAMDSSICSSHDDHPYLSAKYSSNSRFKTTSIRRNGSSCIPIKNYRKNSTSSKIYPSRRTMSTSSSPQCSLNVSPFGIYNSDYPCHCHKHEDFTFDLSYLYSLPAYLNHVFDDQYSRLCVSRLFDPPCFSDNHSPSNEFLHNLKVTATMKEHCRTIDGIVYAIDARESAEQLSHLYYELNAVLRGFPSECSQSIPIVVLYIMPKEEILLTTARDTAIPFQPGLINRDSYSGAEYTAAWHDSLMLPISSLRLFELPNPWRLQKCSSNDIKTLIQSVMWLHQNRRYPCQFSD